MRPLSSRLQTLLQVRPASRKVPPQMALIVLVLLAAAASALLSASGRRRATQQEAPDATVTAAAQAAEAAEDAKRALAQPVESAYEAARKGDVATYLAQFTDPLRTQLDRTRAQQGDAYLKSYLSRLTGTVKGVAVDLTSKEDVGPDLARLRVELVYADHNEAQPFVLRHEGTIWRISKIEALRSAPTLIPYGTPLEQVPTGR